MVLQLDWRAADNSVKTEHLYVFNNELTNNKFGIFYDKRDIKSFMISSNMTICYYEALVLSKVRERKVGRKFAVTGLDLGTPHRKLWKDVCEEKRDTVRLWACYEALSLQIKWQAR